MFYDTDGFKHQLRVYKQSVASSLFELLYAYIADDK